MTAKRDRGPCRRSALLLGPETSSCRGHISAIAERAAVDQGQAGVSLQQVGVAGAQAQQVQTGATVFTTAHPDRLLAARSPP